MEQEQTTQAVAEEQTDAQAEPVTEEASARDDGDDLEALLSEFDQSTTQTEAATTPEQTSADTLLKQELTDLRERVDRQQFQADMTSVVESVRGDLDPNTFDDAFIEAWVDAQARRDPRLAKAWSERNNNPSQFKRVVNGLGKSFVKKFDSMPDKQATEDREAVTQAVRGNATKAPEDGPAPDYSDMSDGEYSKAIQKEHGFLPL